MVIIFLAALSLSGCVPQQADLKQTEKNRPQRITQSNDELAQTGVRQNQESSVVREQELLQLRSDLEWALRQAQELQAMQEDLRQRVRRVEQVLGKTERLPEDSTTPSRNDIEARIDSLVQVTSSILVQIADFSERIKAVEKK
jgi:hypothetical protein